MIRLAHVISDIPSGPVRQDRQVDVYLSTQAHVRSVPGALAGVSLFKFNACIPTAVDHEARSYLGSYRLSVSVLVLVGGILYEATRDLQRRSDQVGGAKIC